MDARHLAALRHAFTSTASRRGLLAVLGGGLLMSSQFGLGGETTDARRSGKRRGKRKRHAKRKTRKGGTQQPLPPLPATQVAATCAASSPPFTHIATAQSRLAQTFTALASGPLVRADLVMVMPPGAGGGEFACSGSGSDTCPGAGFRSFDQTGSFLDLGSDLFFTTFVTS